MGFLEWERNQDWRSRFCCNFAFCKSKNMARTSSGEKVRKSPPSKSAGKKNSAATAFRSDSRHTATLVKIGSSGAIDAIRSSKALGLPITYMLNGIVYREQPDGSKEIIKESKRKRVIVKGDNILKKGVILHAR
jgi:hypothetical protein